MKLLLNHLIQTPNSTVSELQVNGGFCCLILEDGERAIKVAGETRIPAGTYSIKWRKHGKFYTKYHKAFNHAFVPEVVGVPGFSDILIHMGNTVKDTRGCLLTGTSIGYSYTLGNFFIPPGCSTQAYLRLYDLLFGAFVDNEAVEIEVRRPSELMRMVPYICVECKQQKQRTFGDMLHTMDATRCPECKRKTT